MCVWCVCVCVWCVLGGRGARAPVLYSSQPIILFIALTEGHPVFLFINADMLYIIITVISVCCCTAWHILQTMQYCRLLSRSAVCNVGTPGTQPLPTETGLFAFFIAIFM